MEIKKNNLIKKSKWTALLFALLTMFVSCEEDPYTFIKVDNSLPLAGFTITVSKLEVTFINKSTDATMYIWDFGDGQTSNEVNPKHTYATKGKFNVTLAAADNNDESNVTTTEVAVGFPLASFTFSADKQKVTFTNTSSNATSYSWDFGDGKTSTEKNPIYNYTKGGKYAVTLTAIDGPDINKTTNEVTVLSKTVPIILNPSFELADRTMWAVPPATSTYTASQSPKAPDLANGAKLGNAAQYLDQKLVVDANQEYTINYYFCSLLATGGGIVKITDGAGNLIKTADASATPTNAYVLRTVTFNTGTATTIRIRCEYVATEIRFDMFTIQ